MNKECQAILIINPVKNYLSSDVYCCIVRNTGLKLDMDFLTYMNQNYSGFSDAVSLVSIGEIENLEKMEYKQSGRLQASFETLSKAKEAISTYNLYFYDMSGEKYKWIKL